MILLFSAYILFSTQLTSARKLELQRRSEGKCSNCAERCMIVRKNRVRQRQQQCTWCKLAYTQLQRRAMVAHAFFFSFLLELAAAPPSFLLSCASVAADTRARASRSKARIMLDCNHQTTQRTSNEKDKERGKVSAFALVESRPIAAGRIRAVVAAFVTSFIMVFFPVSGSLARTFDA